MPARPDITILKDRFFEKLFQSSNKAFFSLLHESSKNIDFNSYIYISLTLVMLNKDATPTSNFQLIRLIDLDCCYKFTYLIANSADSDQLVSSEANWSGSTLFAKTWHVVFSERRVKLIKYILVFSLNQYIFLYIQGYLFLNVIWEQTKGYNDDLPATYIG